jgi:hypothetical protein
MAVVSSVSETFQTARHKVDVWHQGIERQPVVVIDNYLSDPDTVISRAAHGPPFAPNGPYYPGIRAPFAADQLGLLLDPLQDVFARIFDAQSSFVLQECNFSLITTLPKDLMPIQRLPHFDSLEYGRLAALLFLDKSENAGGTAFYRQRSTGFETVDAGRYAQFGAALNGDVDRFGLPEADYIGDDNPMYETIAMHEGRFNRMLVYRSATLHSGRLPKDFAFSPDPRKGRLTVNAFLGLQT